MLISAVASVIAFWNYNMFDNQMVSRLYRMQTKQESSNQESAEWSPKQAAKT